MTPDGPRRARNAARWRVIACAQQGNPRLSTWCVFIQPGPPNSDHPVTTNRALARRIAALLNKDDDAKRVAQRDAQAGEGGQVVTRKGLGEGPSTGQSRGSTGASAAGASTGAPGPRIGTWYRRPRHKWHYLRPGARIATCGRSAGPWPGDDSVTCYLRALDAPDACVICVREATKDAQAPESNG